MIFLIIGDLKMKKNDIEAIKKCRIFRGIEESICSELLQSGKYEIRNYLRNETVFSPETFNRCIALILKGSAEVSKETDKGKLYMSTLYIGNVFGMSSVFYDGEGFPTSVVAKEPMRVLFITKSQLQQLFVLYPVISENLLSILSSKIHFLNEKIESISSSDAKAAIRNYLLDTAKKIGKNEFSLPVSYQKLASMLSIGRTSLYRAFDELTKDGFLTKNGKMITINYPERN